MKGASGTPSASTILQVLRTATASWLPVESIANLLTNYPSFGFHLSAAVPAAPKNGDLFLFSASAVDWRKDGQTWASTQQAQLDRRLACAHAENADLQRRAYWLADQPGIVLVHYLMSTSSRVRTSQPLPSQQQQQQQQAGGAGGMSALLAAKNAVAEDAEMPQAAPLAAPAPARRGRKPKAETAAAAPAAAAPAASAVLPATAEPTPAADEKPARGRKRKSAALSTTDKLERTRARKAEVARECRKRKKNYIQTLEQKISELQARLSEAEGKAKQVGTKVVVATAAAADATHAQQQEETKKRMREVLADLQQESPKTTPKIGGSASGAVPLGSQDSFSLATAAAAAASGGLSTDDDDDESLGSEDPDSDTETKGGGKGDGARSGNGEPAAKRRRVETSSGTAPSSLSSLSSGASAKAAHTHAGQSALEKARELELAELLIRMEQNSQNRTDQFEHYLQKAESCMLPGAQVRFAMWCLDQREEFYQLPGLFQTLVTEELALSPQQLKKLMYRPAVHASRSSLLELQSKMVQMTNEIRDHVIQRNILVERIRAVLDPVQLAKLCLWVEDRPMCMDMLNSVWKNTSSSKLLGMSLDSAAAIPSSALTAGGVAGGIGPAASPSPQSSVASAAAAVIASASAAVAASSSSASGSGSARSMRGGSAAAAAVPQSPSGVSTPSSMGMLSPSAGGGSSSSSSSAASMASASPGGSLQQQHMHLSHHQQQHHQQQQQQQAALSHLAQQQLLQQSSLPLEHESAIASLSMAGFAPFTPFSLTMVGGRDDGLAMSPLNDSAFM